MIGALNIKGANSPSSLYKWDLIVRKMKRDQIGILCISETHADATLELSLRNKHPSFHIVHTYDPDHTQANGVAVIINTNLIWTEPTNISILKPGRVVSLTIDKPLSFPLNLLAVYAPNVTSTGSKNAEFWRELEATLHSQNHRIHLLLGDCNVVEEATDRLPPRPDAWQAVSALQSLCNQMNLEDGWRKSNPYPKKQYTFGHNTGAHMSCIDRIYASPV